MNTDEHRCSVLTSSAERERAARCRSIWSYLCLSVFICGSLLSATRAFALSGTVRDNTGAPITGALVSATQPKLRRATTVYSDANGRFSVPGLEPGLYDLRVRRIGYQDLVQTGVAVGDGAAPLDLRVEP